MAILGCDGELFSGGNNSAYRCCARLFMSKRINQPGGRVKSISHGGRATVLRSPGSARNSAGENGSGTRSPPLNSP